VLRLIYQRQERRYTRRVLAALAKDRRAGLLDSPAALQERTLAALTTRASFWLGRSRRFERVVREVVPTVISATADWLQESFPERAGKLLAQDHEERAALEQGIAERWGDALTLLELLRLVCLEAGEAVHSRYSPPQGDVVYGVLVRLHARGCLVAAEIIALLKAGLASGAHSRWRSLHEIAVVAAFIVKHGDEVARRYTEHQYIDQYWGARDHQQHASRLNVEPFTAEEIATIEQQRRDALERYGRDFDGQHGWASAVLGPRPTFGQIEADVNLDHWRPYYRMAGHATHAGPRGIAFNLGVLRDAVMLAGPSNAGLADPGASTAISLNHLTALLVSHSPVLGDVVAASFATRLVDPIRDAFRDAERQLDEEEGIRPPGTGTAHG
jgi:hypothetical protein